MNRKLGIYLIAMLAMLIFLITSNSIVVMLSNSPYKVEAVNIDTVTSTSKAYATLLNYNMLNDALESIELSGKAGCEIVGSNSNKIIKIILKGKKHNFSVSAARRFSNDINVIFHTKNIKGFDNAFDTQFSTITLPNDIYRVYVYSHENDEEYGLADTGFIFQKTNQGFEEYVPPRINNIEGVFSDAHKVWVDYQKDLENGQDGKYITVSGIAAVIGKESTNQKAYVVLTDSEGKEQVYATHLRNNTHLSSILENGILYSFNTEYYAKIPIKNLNDNEYSIHIVIENEELYKSPVKLLYRRDNAQSEFKQIFLEPIVDAPEDIDTCTNALVWTEWSNLTTGKKARNYVLSGYAFLLKDNFDNMQAVLSVQNSEGEEYYFPIEFTESEWAAKSFELENSRVAYSMQIADNYFTSPVVDLKIMFLQDGKVKAKTPGKRYALDDKGQYQRQYLVDNFAGAQIDHTVAVTYWNSINKAQESESVSINGIAYIADTLLDSKYQNVYLEISDLDADETKTYHTKLNYNNWVEENIGARYAYSQFDLVLANEELPKADLSMRLLIENADGLFATPYTQYYKWTGIGYEVMPISAKYSKQVDNLKGIELSKTEISTYWNSIDTADPSGNFIINGISCKWDSDWDSASQTVYLEVCDLKTQELKTYKADLTQNIWMAETVGEKARYTQFNITLSQEMLPQSDVSIRLLIENQGIVYASPTTLHYQWNGANYEMVA